MVRWHYYRIVTILFNYVLHCVWLVLVVVCMVTHIARVWINRVRLPVLHVVSYAQQMAINVSVQHNDGLLPDIILLTQCYYHRETRLNANAMERFCICSL